MENSSCPDVSILVINFNSGQFLPACIDSLLQQKGVGQIEILIIDSASTIDQSRYFEALRCSDVRVIALDQNLGYGRACNLGVAESSGRMLVLANADVIALPGALQRLLDHLEQHRDVAFAAPRGFLNRNKTFAVPNHHQFGRRTMLVDALRASSRTFARWHSFRLANSRLKYWQSRGVTDHHSLSGAFLTTRRATMSDLGGFDPDYPLYFEDTDLFRRCLLAGLRLVTIADSEIIHFGHRSSATVWGEAMHKLRLGRQTYVRKHFDAITVGIDWALAPISRGLGRVFPPKATPETQDLGTCKRAPKITWQADAQQILIELAFDPYFVEAAGHLGSGQSFAVPDDLWNSLISGRYFFRAFKLPEMQVLGFWSATKP